ncbi:hypothetical protein Pcinc_013172 [Petrolisthes cinctipes]|uniref:Uncharacterized protein n=1 Tax=Petrolisthes cinctipes TaxID=88211 RepID=A0AAE1FXY4_PETCI|nr:hypothetical protein Pcinc_013172 [Petrolisthes cinctipes]
MGLRGHVGFMESGGDGQEVVVAATIKGTVKGEAFVWKVYSTPLSPYSKCIPQNYGHEILDLSGRHGLLASDTVVGVGTLDLWHLLERALVLKSPTTLRVVCSTLSPTTPLLTFTATFLSHQLSANILRRHMLDHKSTFDGTFYEGCIEQAIPLTVLKFVAMLEHGMDFISQLRCGASKSDLAIAQLLQYNCYARSSYSQILQKQRDSIPCLHGEVHLHKDQKKNVCGNA